MWKSVQTNRRRDARTLISIASHVVFSPQFTRWSLHFWAFHYCHFLSLCPCLVSLRKNWACPRYRVAPLARQSLTRFENIKSLSSCFKRGRRIARIGTQREANALCVSSAKCRLFEISYVSLDDCFAALQIVYPPCGGRRISPRLIDLTVYGIVPFFPVSTI